MGQSNFPDFLFQFFLKMEDLQLSTLHLLVFNFSKTRKSSNMSVSSASKKEHLFFRILSSGCFFIANVTHTKILVFFFLLNEWNWKTRNRFNCNIYIYIYIIIYNICYIYVYILYKIYIVYTLYIYIIYIYIYIVINPGYRHNYADSCKSIN